MDQNRSRPPWIHHSQTLPGHSWSCEVRVILVVEAWLKRSFTTLDVSTVRGSLSVCNALCRWKWLGEKCLLGPSKVRGIPPGAQGAQGNAKGRTLRLYMFTSAEASQSVAKKSVGSSTASTTRCCPLSFRFFARSSTLCCQNSFRRDEQRGVPATRL